MVQASNSPPTRPKVVRDEGAECRLDEAKEGSNYSKSGTNAGERFEEFSPKPCFVDGLVVKEILGQGSRPQSDHFVSRTSRVKFLLWM